MAGGVWEDVRAGLVGAPRRVETPGKKRGIGMGVQMVANQDQALGLAVARMIRESLH